MQYFFDALVGIVGFEIESLEVENYLRDVLFDTFNRAEFVLHAFYLYTNDCRAGECRKQNSAESVAKGDTVTAFERLDDELALTAVGIVFESDFWCLDFHHDILVLLLIQLFFKRFFLYK